MATLFLVEDDASIRQSLARALEAKGHAVASASRALDGLRDIVAAPPDAVVLDLGLPDVDGGELLRMLRAVSDVPVLVATARERFKGQLPAAVENVLMLLERSGIVTYEQLKGAWRYAVVAAFAIAAVLTPPDVVSQLILAVPLIGLYAVSIVGIWFTRRRRQAATDIEAA